MRVLCPKVLVRNRDLRANEKNEYSSNKTKFNAQEFLVNFCFIAAILILFCLPVNCARKNSYKIMIYGQTKQNEYGSNKTQIDQKLMHSNFCFIAAIFSVCP